MAKLVKCKTCEKEIAKGARNCPHCGQSNPTLNLKKRGKGCLLVFMSILFALGVLALIGTLVEKESSSTGQKDEALVDSTQTDVVQTNPTDIEAWYNGGTLHQSTIAEWMQATESNKLATSANYLFAVSEEFKDLAMKDVNAKVLKDTALSLVTCIDKVGESPVAADRSTSETAAICWTLMTGPQ